MLTEKINLLGFLTSSWVASNLRITDAEAKQIGESIATAAPDSNWVTATNRKTFAVAYLDAYRLDPGYRGGLPQGFR